ncbi:MAG: hypothetical protein GF418_07730, partial [Chitinivibrionales bacterium]|nr:hypothetical protein [Chitinivibrionales bacterium]MBD3395503.1 hypothetical protein [Chitinivibrionales bacterium]
MILSPSTWPSNVHVVIPAYRAAGSLETFLPLLLEVAPAERVLVIDDASLDGTDRVCGHFGIACMVQP